MNTRAKCKRLNIVIDPSDCIQYQVKRKRANKSNSLPQLSSPQTSSETYQGDIDDFIQGILQRPSITDLELGVLRALFGIDQ